jgi:hypothetical protein
VLKVGQFGKWIRNNQNVLKCGAGEDKLYRSLRNEEVLGIKEEEVNIIQINRRKANWLVTCCVGTVF